MGLTLEHPPPPDHPLHTISVFSPAFYLRDDDEFYASREPFQIRFLEQLSGHSRLRRIILQRAWLSVSMIGSDTPSRSSWLRDCARICMERGIRLEDVHGVAFERSPHVRSLS
jgi:hypothetical protein